MPDCTGPRKPSASSTRSASSVNSLPSNRRERRRRPHAHGMQLLHASLLVAGKAHAVDAPVADAALFVAALRAQLHRPHRPWRRWRALVWRLRHDLELVNALRASGAGWCPGSPRRCRRRPGSPPACPRPESLSRRPPGRPRSAGSAAAETPSRSGCPSARGRGRQIARTLRAASQQHRKPPPKGMRLKVWDRKRP